MSLSPGARQLPLHHVSIRVPWHDSGWDGRVCADPIDNASCLVLPRIAETKNDQEEAIHHLKLWTELPEVQRPACQAERGAFMAPFEFTRHLSHPYAGRAKTHVHFAETQFRHPTFSANAIPFAWMQRKRTAERVEQLGLGFQQDFEDAIHEEMAFETNWVQVKSNQLVMLDTFFGALKAKQSLCFFYAKDTPLTDDPRRVIVGVGRVEHVGDAVEYGYKSAGPHRAMGAVEWHPGGPRTCPRTTAGLERMA